VSRLAPTGRILAVVTGGGSGIGLATAELLASRGARVVLVDVDGVAAKAAAERTGGAGYEADVADAAAMSDLAAEVLTNEGVPDLLVNNAGVGLTGCFLDTSPADWDWLLGINLMGVVHGCRVFGPAMLGRGHGHVVNVSSGLAYTPRATEPAYVASKAAVLALSRCLRADWGPRGVGVSAVCPGVIATSIAVRTRFVGDRAGDAAAIRRLFSHGHRPELVARAVVDAAERDRPVVPVGIEARAGWLLRRLLPSWVEDVLARSGPF
jgi:2-hydroxycyclohexanecarboxyl-CoA dehydrogenase